MFMWSLMKESLPSFQHEPEFSELGDFMQCWEFQRVNSILLSFLLENSYCIQNPYWNTFNCDLYWIYNCLLRKVLVWLVPQTLRELLQIRTSSNGNDKSCSNHHSSAERVSGEVRVARPLRLFYWKKVVYTYHGFLWIRNCTRKALLLSANN